MPPRFVNRDAELQALQTWWKSPGLRTGLVWGRRRVGKTALLQRFVDGRRAVFHTGAGRARAGELTQLSRQVAAEVDFPLRDLSARPYRDWDDALDHLAGVAAGEPLLVVLDEFPELVRTSPELPGILRAFLDRARTHTQLRLLVCGSAVRVMQALQEERAPLYGRFDLVLHLHPFRPHEAARMLPGLTPPDRALVYGITGGVPLYLSWWDQEASPRENLRRLVCQPGAPLLTEGQLVLATEVEPGEYPAAVLHAIATGKTRHAEIKDQIRTEPTRTLERLIDLRLVERLAPVTESERSRRRIYRITDSFLAFYLGPLARYRAEIERGLGESILPVLMASLDDHMGAAFEASFRDHLRLLASRGALGPDIVAVGPWWTGEGQDQIDAVALRGRARVPVLAGEAKWARSVDAHRLERGLLLKAGRLVEDPQTLRLAIGAREVVRGATGKTLTVTADDIFSLT